MFALIDGNNFYASIEVFFNPRYRNCPVVVLSNNDGCVIARNDMAKRLGYLWVLLPLNICHFSKDLE
ncbi:MULTISPECIES: hypothetical protein [unclassified Proteiniphilum]|jgi:DNA polymerase V|uniref:Y-family DNA polymerase n=1 Tax=Proteiniphilum sp. UBA5310 TaxID=1947275 RepID=UPI0039C998BB